MNNYQINRVEFNGAVPFPGPVAADRVHVADLATVVYVPVPPPTGSVVDTLRLRDSASVTNNNLRPGAIDSFRLDDQATAYLPVKYPASSDSFRLGDHVKLFVQPASTVGAIEFLRITDTATVQRIGQPAVGGGDRVRLQDLASAGVTRLISVSAADAFAMRDRAVPTLQQVGQPAQLPVAASDSIRLKDQVKAPRDIFVFASDGLGLSGPGEGNLGVDVGADDALTVFDRAGSNQFHDSFTTDGLVLEDVGSAQFVPFGQVDLLYLKDRADARISLAPGGGPPGDTGSGLQDVLYQGLTEDWPVSWAETPNGLILLANGIDPMIRWDALKAQCSPAGIVAPAAPIALGGFGVGMITGQYNAYVRFLDAEGMPSNLSPISNTIDCGFDGVIESLYQDTNTGLLVVIDHGHGIPPGDPIPITIAGVLGIPGANQQWLATAIDENHFYLSGVAVPPGTYQAGGIWTYGVQAIAYSQVQLPTDPRIVRRQILRNLDADASVYYVDIDTTDLVSDTFISIASDEQLSAGDPVPILYRDETPHANRYGVPPAHKLALAAHLGRIFAAGEVTYDRGSALLGFGSAIVDGIGTQWRATFAGRFFYVVGASQAYEIAAVDEAAQRLTLLVPFTDPVGPIVSYAIRPAPGERRLLYFSEPGLPEAWPAWNAAGMPEDGDEITGLLVKASFLYILERRNIYKYTFQADPAVDGFSFLTTRRGCLNHRCHVQAEDTVYMLDDTGIHKFDGQNSEAISQPIQQLFQQGIGIGCLQVNWDADQRLWHAAHDPIRDTIRWFVAMAGWREPRHAICYDYRRERWWLEEYPVPINSSTIGTIGHRRSIAGTTARRVLCLSQGTTDGVDQVMCVRNTVGQAGPMSLVDPTVSFSGDLGGSSLQIVAGKGKDQARVITSAAGNRLGIDRPWRIIPDGSSTYQIAGVPWSWRSGWYALTPDEAENPRDLDLVYEPLRRPTTVDAQLFYDHAHKPRVWSITTAQDGVATSSGDATVQFAVNTARGFSRQRLAGHADPYAYGDQFVSVRLLGVQATEPVQIYAVMLRGAQESSSQ